MQHDPSGKGLAELTSDLFHEVLALVRGEARLARAEMAENVRRATDGLVLVAGGVGLMAAGLVVTLQAIVIGLTNLGLAPGWSAVVVGVATIGAACALFMLGMSRFKAKELTPTQTLSQIEKDKELLKRVAGQ